MVNAVRCSDAVNDFQSEVEASQSESAELLAQLGHLYQKSRIGIADHRCLSESLKLMEGQLAAARRVEYSFRAICDEILRQEGMAHEHSQAASDDNNRHRATIVYQSRENA